MATLVDSGGGGGAVAGNARLQTRLALLTVLLGIYLLLMASYYLQFWDDSFMHPLKYLSAGTAFATQGAHVAIIYGLFVRRFLGSRDELVYGLCASLACSLVFNPLSCFTVFAALLSKHQEAVGLWEMPRIGLTLLHMNLIRRLLKEIRALDTLPPHPSLSASSSAPSPSSTPPLDTSGPRPLLPPPRPPQPPPALTSPPSPPSTPPPPTPPATSPPHSPPPSPPPSPPTRSSSTSTLTPPPPPTPPPTPHMAAKTQQAAPDDT